MWCRPGGDFRRRWHDDVGGRDAVMKKIIEKKPWSPIIWSFDVWSLADDGLLKARASRASPIIAASHAKISRACSSLSVSGSSCNSYFQPGWVVPAKACTHWAHLVGNSHLMAPQKPLSIRRCQVASPVTCSGSNFTKILSQNFIKSGTFSTRRRYLLSTRRVRISYRSPSFARLSSSDILPI